MNGMISHANGDASWHREQRGIKTPEQKRIEELESMGVTEACAELPPVMEYFQQCEKRIEMLLEDCIEYCKRIEFLESQLAKCKRDAERYKEIAEYLFDIIDDIDTYSDMAKHDNALYRSLVEKRQADRWQTGITTDGYTLNIDAAIDAMGEKK